MIVIHDIQCSWCGGREVTDCLTCNHVSCDNCGVGGYCYCEHKPTFNALYIAGMLGLRK